MNEKGATIAKWLSTKRPAWKLQLEDDIITIGTNQSLVEWPIFEDIVNMFKVKIRNVTSLTGTVLVTINLGDQ